MFLHLLQFTVCLLYWYVVLELQKHVQTLYVISLYMQLLHLTKANPLIFFQLCFAICIAKLTMRESYAQRV